MEFIFPQRMGYQPMPVSKAEEQQSWQGLMLEFPSTFSRAALAQTAKDHRASELQAMRISSRSINLLCSLAKHFTSLDAIFLFDEGLDFLNKENDPADLLNAYPGLSKIYMKKGFENPGLPLRHIGLDYLGLPYTPTKKRLDDLICPNLSILALDMEGINFYDSPVLASELIEELKLVVSGRLFPLLERLHISNCEFINRLASEVLVGDCRLRHLDVMKSFEIGYDGVQEPTDIQFLSEFTTEQGIQLTTDEAAKAVPYLIETNTVLLPY